jgi:hypothetical protein
MGGDLQSILLQVVTDFPLYDVFPISQHRTKCLFLGQSIVLKMARFILLVNYIVLIVVHHKMKPHHQ